MLPWVVGMDEDVVVVVVAVVEAVPEVVGETAVVVATVGADDVPVSVEASKEIISTEQKGGKILCCLLCAKMITLVNW